MIVKIHFILGVVLMLLKVSAITAEDGEDNVNQLKSALQANNYKRVSELSKIIDNTQFNAAISEVLKNNLHVINLNQLIECFSKHDDKAQSIHVFSVIFHELKSKNLLIKDELVNLAFALKQLLTQNLSAEVKEAANKLKYELPVSIKNLAFANRVCIVNSGQQAFLFAHVILGSITDPRNEKRKVYASSPLTWTDERRFWIVEPYNNAVHLKNYIHNEYLYSPVGALLYGNDEARAAFTLVSGTFEQEKYEWLFESYGDLVRIRNNHYRELLYAYDKDWDEDTTPVATSKEDNKRDTFMPDFLWKVEDCS